MSERSSPQGQFLLLLTGKRNAESPRVMQELFYHTKNEKQIREEIRPQRLSSSVVKC